MEEILFMKVCDKNLHSSWHIINIQQMKSLINVVIPFREVIEHGNTDKRKKLGEGVNVVAFICLHRHFTHTNIFIHIPRFPNAQTCQVFCNLWHFKGMKCNTVSLNTKSLGFKLI